ncbi:MAG: NfeD family protein, partial [Pseudomonadota bacterium]
MPFEITALHWVLLAFVLLAIEIQVPIAFFLFLAGAAFCSALVALILPDMSWQAELILFSAFCIISVVAWMYRPRKELESDAPLLNQRNRQYLGRTVVVAQPIQQGIGKVKVDDSIWKALGPDSEVGTRMK